jgi:hypothetical protein
LKTKCRNYRPKKAATFSRNDVCKFLLEAADQEWILQKVILIMGIFGGCRCDELCKMMINDVEEHIEDVNPTLVVKIPITKTGVSRSFTVVENGMGINFLDIYKKYKERRPIPDGRLFLQSRKGTFTRQVLGVNSIDKVPGQIAEYLKLPERGSFTGHSLRRTSATLLADSGADILTLKRHGSWKSNSVAESYVSASKTSKLEIAKKISENAPGCSTSNSVAGSHVSASKTSKLEIAKQNSENAPGCSSTLLINKNSNIFNVIANNITAQTEKEVDATKEVNSEIDDVFRIVEFKNCKIDKIDIHIVKK